MVLKGTPIEINNITKENYSDTNKPFTKVLVYFFIKNEDQQFKANTFS